MTGSLKQAGVTIALVAGGTGGHIFPALAVARELQDRGHAVIFLSDERGAAYLEQEQDLPHQILKAADPRGGTAKALLALPRAVLQARRVLSSIEAEAVVGFGGYATLAVMLAAKTLRLPTSLHEQNAVMGRVNKRKDEPEIKRGQG